MQIPSAGMMMVKDSAFRTAYAYSGGAVTTFALYSLVDGHLERAGNAYAYEGFIREDYVRERANTDEVSVGPPSLATPTPTPTPSR